MESFKKVIDETDWTTVSSNIIGLEKVMNKRQRIFDGLYELNKIKLNIL